MTIDDRHNEVLKLHAAFFNALAIAAAGGAGFTAIASGNGAVAAVFLAASLVLHSIAATTLQALRITG